MDTGILISLAALLISGVGMYMATRREHKTDAAGAARVETKLDGIASGVEDIRVEMRTMRGRMDSISERLAAVESSCRSAHHRLDQMSHTGS